MNYLRDKTASKEGFLSKIPKDRHQKIPMKTWNARALILILILLKPG